MYPTFLLSTTLLSLLFAPPVLSATTTPYDSFRAIAAHVRKPPEEPICCLKPLTPLEPVADDLFLSFEDWKTKRLAERDAQIPNVSRPANGVAGGGATGDGRGGEVKPDASADPAAPTEGSPPSSTLDVAETSPPPTPETLAPHFRIPLTDRFNYASLDCSARVHTAHRGAKSASNILSSKKDRYMLSPCDAENQFVVVELCEDIWIDTVQLANYEFFSGVFRDFTVNVAKTYATDAAGWTVVGTYTAKNTRGVQSFHPPNSLRDFYRFIRIDFHSHYGNEYYCPISLLRVYGLTHLEQWKWDIWEDESRARMQEQEQQAVLPPAEVDQPSPQPVQTPEGVESESEVPSQPTPTSVDKPVDDSPAANTTEEAQEQVVFRHSTDIARSDSAHSYSSATDTSQPSPPPSEPTPVDVAQTHETTSLVPSDTPPSSSLPPHSAVPESSPSSFSLITTSTSTSFSPPVISLAPSPVHVATTGESIYRTIMNRLTALEANTTLYARYVEEQTAGMREMLRRLTEDVGRLEGIGRVHAQLYQRSVQDFERQRRRMEVEQRELITRVKYLADEITLEKRLGIAQLCLLLAVLVFLSLTRGSRNDFPRAGTRARVPGPVSMKEWGRRNLSLTFNPDWVSRLRTRSLTPVPQDARTTPTPTVKADSKPKPSLAAKEKDKVAFPSPPFTSLPSEKARDKRPAPLENTNPNLFSLASVGRRLRTPSRRYPLAHVVHGSNMRTPGTPTASSRPVLQRSNSHTSAAAVAGSSTTTSLLVGPVPRSAKKWARTAHLHEVRRPVERDENDDASVGGEGDGEGDSERRTKRLRVDTSAGSGGTGRRKVSPLRMNVASSREEADPWVDTDPEGSEVDLAAGARALPKAEVAFVDEVVG